MARNERLYDAKRRSGKSDREIADLLGVSTKTVERWITKGTPPHANTRQRLAQILETPEAILWPTAPGTAYGDTEVLRIYNTRRELSPATVAALAQDAEHHIDILAHAALWLWDTVPDFVDLLELKIAQDVKVRICLGDPDSTSVRLRGKEEGVGDDLVSRCKLAITYTQNIGCIAPGAVRLSDTTLYNSIMRFDNELLINMHIWGNPAANSPVLHVRRASNNGIASNAMRSFDRIWSQAQPRVAG